MRRRDGIDGGDEAVGSAIRQHRRRAGLSQEAFAEALGISANQVSKYELGKNRLTIAKLRQIATILGISPTALLQPLDTRDGSDRPDTDSLESRISEAFAQIRSAVDLAERRLKATRRPD